MIWCVKDEGPWTIQEMIACGWFYQRENLLMRNVSKKKGGTWGFIAAGKQVICNMGVMRKNEESWTMWGQGMLWGQSFSGTQMGTRISYPLLLKTQAQVKVQHCQVREEWEKCVNVANNLMTVFKLCAPNSNSLTWIKGKVYYSTCYLKLSTVKFKGNGKLRIILSATF